ncbi:outer membrane protein [Helicobacter suis]|uniref:outer membrane protein n=1 Tax=Helicobacter suis TaxID=104628 RepID=UPI0013D18ABB|nr:outer membrane protein [Helicobacter suis]
MRFRFLAIPMAFSTFAGLTPLSAEKSGAYMEGGFQYSTMLRGAHSGGSASPLGGYANATTLYGNMYGLDTQVGYKQFFGKTKRFGLRYYATFAWQHGTFYNGRTDLANFNYGGGMDFLYDFYQDKDGIKTAGLFAGIALEGSSWLAAGQSGYMTLNRQLGTNAQMNTSYFQLPINLGFRANFTKHQGLELGLRIPLVTNYYYKAVVDHNVNSVMFKRNFSVYMNYVINF